MCYSNGVLHEKIETDLRIILEVKLDCKGRSIILKIKKTCGIYDKI